MGGHGREGSLRFPLTAVLGTAAKVRILRELARHGSEISAPSLTKRTGLAKASVREALGALEAIGIVEAVGSGRAILYRLRRDHPLASALDTLFQQEEARFAAILDAVRAAASRPGGVVAVWLYGSVARGSDRSTSDLDIAVAVESGRSAPIARMLRELLRDAQERLAFRASVVVVELSDILRLDSEQDRWWAGILRDALPIAGDSPDALLARLKRRGIAPGRKAS